MSYAQIIPLDRSLDNSFFNKTLCYVEENKVKGNRTPYEAYGNTPKWEEILQRVRNFKSDKAVKAEKLRRFQMHGKELENFLRDFSHRQLNDTAYSSRLAMEYLGTLYGGSKGIDKDGRRRIQATSGQVTNYLRNVWDLNKILNDGGEKSRKDHRHHAVDAICIALTDAGTVKMLSDAARRARSERRRQFGKVNPPWPNFLDEVRSSIEAIKVSHRVSRKVSGPLHEESNYSRPVGKDEKGKDIYRIRKPLEKLSGTEVNQIADLVVRRLVQDKLNASEKKEPKEAFKDRDNHPFFLTRDGRKIPIHKVRINARVTPFPIGKGPNTRYVTTDANHHIEVVEVRNKKGKPKWERYLVSLKDAYERLGKDEPEPVVKRDHGEDKSFVFSLAGGETIEIDEEDGKRGLYIIRSISKDPRIDFVRIEDARKIQDIKATKDWRRETIETLRKLNCQKVLITPLGEVRRAND